MEMDMNTLTAPQGWQCPICKRVYSPTTPMCWYCGAETQASARTEAYYRYDGELPIKQMVCNGEVVSDELKADGTLVKRLGCIELSERKGGAEKKLMTEKGER